MNFSKSVTLLLVIFVVSTTARPSTEQGKRLIKISEAEPGTWLNEEEIISLIHKKVKFMDITDRNFPAVDLDRNSVAVTKAIPDALRFGTTVTEAISKINISRMQAFVTEFSAFHNRYYSSATGVASSEWLLSQISDSIIASGYKGNASVNAVTHTWAQKSIIARLEGSDSSLKSEVVILGAHLDSVQSFNPVAGLSPGADDNGSGSVVLLETLRVILESGIIPKRSVEFQWYAAEEVGLRGSGDIAKRYFDSNVNVASMMNFDVVGYHTQGRNEIGLITDYTSPILVQFLRVIIEGYLNFSWINIQCGYACSDHASWTQLGYPAAIPAEVVNNPNMHTVRDTIDRVDFNQVLEFAKLAVGYTIEIAEPNL